MVNLKWGLIAALCALFVSMLMGILFGVGLSHIIIRAIIFSSVFFAIGFGLRFIINSFFPELLISDDTSGDDYIENSGFEQKSSLVNMNNSGEYAVPELYKEPSDPQEMGNIEDLISGLFNTRNGKASEKGIDGNKDAGYNGTGGFHDISLGIPEEIPFLEGDLQESPVYESTPVKPMFTPSFGDDGGLGGLPDLDMMAKAFSSTFSSSPAPSSSASQGLGVPAFSSIQTNIPSSAVDMDSRSHYKGNRPEPMKGDFNPRELAQGLRSVLSKDK